MKLMMIAVFVAFSIALQGTSDKSSQHQCQMMQRGDQAMGFSQDKATHHFRLLEDGGVIEVQANDPKDADTRAQIRQHLTHIAQLFSEGDFDIPMFIHDTTPPGVPQMKQLRDQIHYRYQETSGGGAVQIQTRNASAVEAIHAFLRFQISEHATGDSNDVTSKPKEN